MVGQDQDVKRGMGHIFTRAAGAGAVAVDGAGDLALGKENPQLLFLGMSLIVNAKYVSGKSSGDVISAR
jgi:hypothetical protein